MLLNFHEHNKHYSHLYVHYLYMQHTNYICIITYKSNIFWGISIWQWLGSKINEFKLSFLESCLKSIINSCTQDIDNESNRITALVTMCAAVHLKYWALSILSLYIWNVTSFQNLELSKLKQYYIMKYFNTYLGWYRLCLHIWQVLEALIRSFSDKCENISWRIIVGSSSHLGMCSLALDILDFFGFGQKQPVSLPISKTFCIKNRNIFNFRGTLVYQYAIF